MTTTLPTMGQGNHFPMAYLMINEMKGLYMLAGHSGRNKRKDLHQVKHQSLQQKIYQGGGKIMGKRDILKLMRFLFWQILVKAMDINRICGSLNFMNYFATNMG